MLHLIFWLISELLFLLVICCFMFNFFQICCFLFNLSHKFSSYYGRVHILGVSNLRGYKTFIDIITALIWLALEMYKLSTNNNFGLWKKLTKIKEK